MENEPNEIVYGVPDWLNEFMFTGSKKQVERKMLKFYGLWR